MRPRSDFKFVLLWRAATTNFTKLSIFLEFQFSQNGYIKLDKQMHTRILQSECYNLFGLVFVWVEALRPSQQLFSHVRTEPPLPGYYQYCLGGKCILLKDTTRRPE